MGYGIPCPVAAARSAALRRQRESTTALRSRSFSPPRLSMYFDHADGLRATLPFRGARHPGPPAVPDRGLAADAGWEGLPRGYRVPAGAYHRAQYAAWRQPEGRGPGHAAGARLGAGQAAGRRLHGGASDPRHGALPERRAAKDQRKEPAWRRSPVGDAGGSAKRPLLPEPGAAGRRDAGADLPALPVAVRAAAGVSAALRRWRRPLRAAAGKVAQRRQPRSRRLEPGHAARRDADARRNAPRAAL